VIGDWGLVNGEWGMGNGGGTRKKKEIST
jgi:hypothetical protein